MPAGRRLPAAVVLLEAWRQGAFRSVRFRDEISRGRAHLGHGGVREAAAARARPGSLRDGDTAVLSAP